MDTKLRLIETEKNIIDIIGMDIAQINRNRKIIIGIIGMDTKLR
jgi:hypothetical protein